MSDHARRAQTLIAVVVALAVAPALAAACNGALGGGETPEPPPPALESEAFLTPVAQAQAMGVTPYWTGTEFQGAGRPFRLDATAYPYSYGEGGPGLGFAYAGETPDGFVLVLVQTFPKAGGGHEAYERRMSSVEGYRYEAVVLGSTGAKLYTLPSASRPVNKLVLFVDLGDTVAVIHVSSGGTGVPGSDPNPLIDKDLLIEVVAENLRPYPE